MKGKKSSQSDSVIENQIKPLCLLLNLKGKQFPIPLITIMMPRVQKFQPLPLPSVSYRDLPSNP